MAKSIRDVTTPAPWTLPATCSLPEAARLMRSWDVREAFVVDDGTFCGVLSDADIIVTAIASGRPPSEITAGECCIPDGPRAEADQPVAEVLASFRLRHLRRGPVVDGDRLVGAVWTNDLEQAVSTEQLPPPPPPDRPRSRVGARAAARGRRGHLILVPPAGELARPRPWVRPADGRTG